LRRFSKNKPVVLKIQRELIDEGKDIGETGAGAGVEPGDPWKWKRSTRDEIRELEESMRRAEEEKDEESRSGIGGGEEENARGGGGTPERLGGDAVQVRRGSTRDGGKDECEVRQMRRIQEDVRERKSGDTRRG
jgi:hypothetical protein